MDNSNVDNYAISSERVKSKESDEDAKKVENLKDHKTIKSNDTSGILTNKVGS